MTQTGDKAPEHTGLSKMIGIPPLPEGAANTQSESCWERNRCTCRRFLNRLLGLPVARQNLLFNYFACTLAAEIRAAKAEGRYFEGVSDLGGSHVSKVEPQVFNLALSPTADPAP